MIDNESPTPFTEAVHDADDFDSILVGDTDSPYPPVYASHQPRHYRVETPRAERRAWAVAGVMAGILVVLAICCLALLSTPAHAAGATSTVVAQPFAVLPLVFGALITSAVLATMRGRAS